MSTKADQCHITVAGGAGEPSKHGFEDALFSARYRLNADGVASSLGLDESYAMVVGGIELPTGTFDHPFGRGPVGEIVAGLLSMEKRPLSLIGYAYYHHTGEHQGLRQSGNVFAGAGTAWTPMMTMRPARYSACRSGSRTSAPLRSNRMAFRFRRAGSGVFVHPGLVVGISPRIQFFSLLSLPITQTWNAEDDRQR